MKRKTIHGAIMLSMLLAGSLSALSATNLKPVQALPVSTFLTEWITLYVGAKNDISNANKTWNYLRTAGCANSLPGCVGNVSLWQPPIQQLLMNLKDQAKLVDLQDEFMNLPYNMFTMDNLLVSADAAVITMRSAQQAIVGIYLSFESGDNGCFSYQQCDNVLAHINDLDHWTQQIQQGVNALGSLYAKAKLEMLEVPRIVCGPLQVTVGGRISCVGFNVNGTATLLLNNTQTSQTTNLGSQKADSFFDVFFEVTLPNSAGAGHYEMIMTDSGGGTATSFFDVFATLPTPFEPATIIPLTVLIVAIATLFVASRRTRRPL